MPSRAPKPPAHTPEEKAALGTSLTAARKASGFTLDAAADELTKRGYPVGKAAISAWENGRNLPDSLWLRRLARLYDTTMDALAGHSLLSAEALRLARLYDALDAREQAAFKSMFPGYLDQVRAVSAGANVTNSTNYARSHHQAGSAHLLQEETSDYASEPQQHGAGGRRHQAIEEFASLPTEGNGSSRNQQPARPKGGGRTR